MVHRLLFKIGLLIFAVIFSLNANAFVKGNSAWLYGKEESWIKQIQSFNSEVPADNRLNYLFPETSIIHIDSKHDALLMTYDPSVTQFYKQSLKNVKVIADLSFWVKGTNFTTWPVAKYEAAADQIAALINNDPNADGAFLDLETYTPSLLPFYARLVKDLQVHHKILSVIIRPGQEDATWFKTLGNNAFVVLYGYDLHEATDGPLPVSPNIYQQRLNLAVNHVMQVATSTHTPVMGGIPVVATTYEWQQKIVNQNSPSANLQNPYPQTDYFKAALQVYNNTGSPLYLGFSIWAFLSGSRFETYFPNQISDEEWDLLKANKVAEKS